MKTEFMRYMKYAGALVRPNDMTGYSYSPYQVEKGGFWNVTRPDLDFMIVGTKVNLREYFSSG
jgi:hypothetical protein